MERAGLPGAAGFVRADYFEKVYWSEQARRAVDGAGGYGIYYDNMGRLIKRAFATPDSIARRIVTVRAYVCQRRSTPIFYLIRRRLSRKFYRLFFYRISMHGEGANETQFRSE